MKFRTEINLPGQPGFISYKTRMTAMGSCFADEIGGRLKLLQFPVKVNPFGVIFNPVSIADLLIHSLDSTLQQSLFVQRDGRWFHHGYHSQLNAPSREVLQNQLMLIHADIKAGLAQQDMLLLTFGTAWVYRHLDTDRIVANCHKISRYQFSKELLDLELLKENYTTLFERLLNGNPKLKILLTVSPVRHIKDGIAENNISKSVLLLLTHYLVNRFERVHYFPAYELVLDDLRDYRFYKEDLVHPSKQAVDYVFEKLADTFFTAETQRGVVIQQAILKLKSHQQMGTADELTVQKVSELEEAFLKLNLI